MESSPFVVFVNIESVIDLENTTLGNVVAANAATPPISRSRRVNSAIYPLSVLNNNPGFYPSPSFANTVIARGGPKWRRHSQRVTLARFEDVKPQIASREA
jgi:hypothetical protein